MALAMPGVQAKAIGEIRGHVELAAAYVNGALRGFSKRDDSRIEAMNEGPQRQEVQCAISSNLVSALHFASPCESRAGAA